MPAEALTTGPGQESTSWKRRFVNEVVSDAQRRGLSRDAVDGPVFTVLTLAAAVPALLVWALSEIGAGDRRRRCRSRHSWAGSGRDIRSGRRPEGLAAASRWLGVRAELAENEVFPTHSPLTVELWDRLLAYGAALGVAGGASGPLPMGTESDTDAWSAYGGRWRPVRVAYPRLWPPGWGLDPLIAIVAGTGAALAGALFLYWLGPALFDAGVFGALLIVPCAAVLVGIALSVMALRGLALHGRGHGPILRLRVFGDEKRARLLPRGRRRRIAAVRAWRVNPRHYLGVTQGETVTVASTRNLGCVRWIMRERDAV